MAWGKNFPPFLINTGDEKKRKRENEGKEKKKERGSNREGVRWIRKKKEKENKKGK